MPDDEPVFDGICIIVSGDEMRMNTEDALDNLIIDRVVEALNRWKQSHGEKAKTAS